jgi:hypothetical protein
MTDPQLSSLFADGTAPDHDPAFTAQVAAEIGRARLRTRLLALALQAAMVLTLAGALFVAGRLIEPALVQLAPLVEQSPQFMGVPVPLVLGALLVGLALLARRRLRLRLA